MSDSILKELKSFRKNDQSDEGEEDQLSQVNYDSGRIQYPRNQDKKSSAAQSISPNQEDKVKEQIQNKKIRIASMTDSIERSSTLQTLKNKYSSKKKSKIRSLEMLQNFDEFGSQNQSPDITSATQNSIVAEHFKTNFSNDRKLNDQDKLRERALYGKITLKTMNQDIQLQGASSFFDELINIRNNRKKKSCQEKMILNQDSNVCRIFDFIMLFMNAYSCLASIYQQAIQFFNSISVAFQPVEFGSIQFYWDLVVQFCFLIDLIFQFFKSFRDPQTYKPVTSLSKIAKKYLRYVSASITLTQYSGWFLIDLLALFPFSVILGQNATVSKLLRLLRLPRLMRLVNLSQLQKCAKIFYQYSSRNDRIIAQQFCMYTIRILRTLLVAIMITYFLACIWYFISSNFNHPDDQDTFIKVYFQSGQSYTNWEKLIVCCYFVLTTLITVGYGDLTPQSNTQRAIALIYMIIGAGFFSIVLSNFIQMVASYNTKMGVIDKGLDLHNWLQVLTGFTGNKPLPKKLVHKIDSHFDYFWKTDRMKSLKIDDPFVTALPLTIKKKIITNYLFSDVFFNFRSFFHSQQLQEREFLYELAFGFMPRKFEKAQIIYDEMDQVDEMYLILEGIVNVGFRVSQKQKLCKRIEKNSYIGAYYAISNRKCQFLYKTVKATKAIGIRKDFLSKVFEKYPYQAQLITNSVLKNYQDKLKEPLNCVKVRQVEIHNRRNTYAQMSIQQRQDILPQITQLQYQSKEKEQLKNFINIGTDPVQAYVCISIQNITNPPYQSNLIKTKIKSLQSRIDQYGQRLQHFTGSVSQNLVQITQNVSILKQALKVR